MNAQVCVMKLNYDAETAKITHDDMTQLGKLIQMVNLVGFVNGIGNQTMNRNANSGRLIIKIK